MKNRLFYLNVLSSTLIMVLVSCNTQHQTKKAANTEISNGWKKYDKNPVLGGDLGTIFDVSLLHHAHFEMFCSWRPQRSIALSTSTDGLQWTKPTICLAFNDSSGWEKDVNRPVVIQKDGNYLMWYTGENDSASAIGFAVSADGRQFKRVSTHPVLVADQPWEKKALMCPHVIWDENGKIFRMWYSGGEQYEPDAIGYATSEDGLHWNKYAGNPVFHNDSLNEWEQAKVTACQVIQRKNDFLMFYIGFKNIDYAQIGMARSKDGIGNWERYQGNPIIKPGTDWDSSAVYKPFAIESDGRWLLYYNGRRNNIEQIGVAIHDRKKLDF